MTFFVYLREAGCGGMDMHHSGHFITENKWHPTNSY